MTQNFDPNFYIICATVIPVLFLAAAAQGAAYDVIMGAWHKAEQTSQAALTAAQATLTAALQDEQHIQQATQDAQTAVHAAEQAVGDAEQAVAGPTPWMLLRGAGAAVASPFLQLVAAAILVAGTAGEGLALYVLYRGSEQPGQRKLVFAATLILLAAVVAGPLLAYLQRYIRFIFFPLKLAISMLIQGLSTIKCALSSKTKDSAADNDHTGNG